MSKNNVFHKRIKHMDVRLHFIKEIINDKLVTVKKIDTYQYLAYMFTKVVPINKFEESLSLLRLVKELSPTKRTSS